MQRIQDIRSKRLLVDELIRAIQHIESQSSQGITELSLDIQQNVERLKGLIELNRYDDSKVQKNIDATKKELDTQIKELKQMIADHNKRADENAHSINQMRQAVEAEIHKLKALPKITKQEIVQKADTAHLEEELKRQKENQKVIAEYVKAHQEEQKKANDQFQSSLDRLIAEFLNSQNKPQQEIEIPDYTKQFEDVNNRLLTVEKRGVPARMTPTFAHLEQNYYNKKQIDESQAERVVTGRPNSVAFFGANSSLTSNNTAFFFSETSGVLSIGTNAPYKDANLFVSNVYNGVTDSYGAFVGKSYDTNVNNSAFVGGLAFVVQSTGNAYLSGQVKGLDGIVFHGGTGTANQMLGSQFLVQKTGIGPINVAYGSNYAIMNTVATGAIGTGIAVNIGSPVTTGPITGNFGVYINNQCGANVTNGAGIIILDQTGSSGLNYSIYAVGGKAGFNIGQTNAADFQIYGESDQNLFYADVSNNAIGIGTATPVNKVDVSGGVAIGGAYAGVSTAPTNGLIIQGQISQGTTDFSSIPGASATVFGVVSRRDSSNNSAAGGLYFRTVMTNQDEESFGSYHLISTSGMVITSGTHVLGTQNEIYLQNTGTSTQKDKANGVLNYMESNGAYSEAVGTNNVLLANQSAGQNIGTTNILVITSPNGTHVGDYSVINAINNTSSATIGGAGAAMTWVSPGDTVFGVNVSASNMSAVNNPSAKQIGVYVDWNVPGTDSSNAKWGVYVNSSSVDSAKAYFGDSVMINKKPYVVTGTNKPMGVVTLTAGAANVSANTVTNSTVIMATVQIPGGTVGSIYVAGRTAGTGFTLTSTSATDTSEVGYMMYERTT